MVRRRSSKSFRLLGWASSADRSAASDLPTSSDFLKRPFTAPDVPAYPPRVGQLTLRCRHSPACVLPGFLLPYSIPAIPPIPAQTIRVRGSATVDLMAGRPVGPHSRKLTEHVRRTRSHAEWWQRHGEAIRRAGMTIHLAQHNRVIATPILVGLTGPLDRNVTLCHRKVPSRVETAERFVKQQQQKQLNTKPPTIHFPFSATGPGFESPYRYHPSLSVIVSLSYGWQANPLRVILS
jgi:hypothetical protein